MEGQGPGGEESKAKITSPSSSPWSSFHSSLTLVPRGPGTPVRHQEAHNSSPKRSPASGPPSTVVEFQNHFTELDLLLE